MWSMDEFVQYILRVVIPCVNTRPMERKVLELEFYFRYDGYPKNMKE